MLRPFAAKIDIINGNPFVRPPDRVLESIFKEAGKSRGAIPIRGVINRARFQQSLVKYKGDWRLYVNGVMAHDAGLEYTGSISAIVGTKVDMEVEFNPRPPEYPMPAQFKTVLDKDKKAKKAFEELTPGRQKEILRYLGFMKTDTSLERNIGRVIKHLRGEKTDALYPLFHRKQE